jgi:hypothetical protein
MRRFAPHFKRFVANPVHGFGRKRKVRSSTKRTQGTAMNSIKTKIELFTIALICVAAVAAQLSLFAQAIIA